MISIKKIIKNEMDCDKYSTFVLCVFCNSLVLVPCEEHMSGYYPKYEDSYALVNYVNFPEVSEIEGILYNMSENETYMCYDTHDGFQIVDELDIDNFLTFMNLVCNIMNKK